jgi:large subunit ribosomal protein L9
MRALAEARRAAEEERTRRRAELEDLATRLQDVEVTIRARANEEGVLYGSVGAQDIADALAEEGYYLKREQIALDRPIRHLDTVAIDVKLADDLRSSIKVWVVREKGAEDRDAEESEELKEPEAGTEAGEDDDRTIE